MEFASSQPHWPDCDQSYCSPISPLWTLLPESNILYATLQIHTHTHTVTHWPPILKLSQNSTEREGEWKYWHYTHPEHHKNKSTVPALLKPQQLLFDTHKCAHSAARAQYVLSFICSASPCASDSSTSCFIHVAQMPHITYSCIDLCWFMVILWHVVVLAYFQHFFYFQHLFPHLLLWLLSPGKHDAGVFVKVEQCIPSFVRFRLKERFWH